MMNNDEDEEEEEEEEEEEAAVKGKIEKALKAAAVLKVRKDTVSDRICRSVSLLVFSELPVPPSPSLPAR